MSTMIREATVRDAMARGEIKIPLANTTKTISPFDDGTLVRLLDYGHDLDGKYAHINVSVGMVDVRKTKSKFYRKNENGIWEGYQREPTKKRVEDITKDFTKTKLNPITVAVMSDGIYVIDGQGRDTSVKTLYRQKRYSDYYVPCMILENATDDDCANLFAEQDKNTVYIDIKSKVRVAAANNDKETIEFLKILNRNGLPIYNEKTKEVYYDFNAMGTYKSIYEDFKSDPKTFDRIIKVIGSVWVSNEISGRLIAPKALQADIIKGISEMYVRYKDEIDDTAFIKRLSKYTPEQIIDTIKIHDNNQKKSTIADKKYKYIRTFVDIYNSARQSKKIDY